MKQVHHLIFFLLINVELHSASIKGFVTDSETGEPLVGVNVIILGSRMGAATDINGFYIIKDLSPGKYKIKTSYIGYSTHIDSTMIMTQEEIIELNIKLKVPFIDLDKMSAPELEAYHNRLQELNKIKKIMLINIDSLAYSEDFLIAYISMKNNTGDSLYIFKNYACFQVIRPIIKDNEGKLIKQNMGMYDCLGEKICPDSSDLILIRPGETIKYPKTKLLFYNFSRYPKGGYSIEIKYEFKNLQKFNTYFCWGSKLSIKALVTGLRGSYFSSNKLMFINQ